MFGLENVITEIYILVKNVLEKLQIDMHRVYYIELYKIHVIYLAYFSYYLYQKFHKITVCKLHCHIIEMVSYINNGLQSTKYLLDHYYELDNIISIED